MQLKFALILCFFHFVSCFGNGSTQSCPLNSAPSGSCRLSVQIRSEGSNDPGITAPGSSAIIVGGADYSLKSQGFNLAVLQQKTGHILQKKAFDVVANAANVDLMKQFIASLPNQVIILIAVQTTGTLSNPNDIFGTMGVNFTAIESQQSFSAVICKGTGPFCIKTKHSHRASASGPSYLSIMIPMDYPCTKGSSYRIEYTDPIQNYKISGPVSKTLTVPSEVECKNTCFFDGEEACYMFNYYSATTKCELLYKDRAAEYSVVATSGSSFRTQKCVTNSCPPKRCYSLGTSSHNACI